MKRVTKAALTESNLSKEQYELLITKVKGMGEQAFKDGKQSAPVLNKELKSIVFESGYAFNVRLNLMEAYSGAWFVMQRKSANEELAAAGF